eukprot:15456889-Alexandrium_andersonii.AAC.1
MACSIPQISFITDDRGLERTQQEQSISSRMSIDMISLGRIAAANKSFRIGHLTAGRGAPGLSLYQVEQ